VIVLLRKFFGRLIGSMVAMPDVRARRREAQEKHGLVSAHASEAEGWKVQRAQVLAGLKTAAGRLKELGVRPEHIPVLDSFVQQFALPSGVHAVDLGKLKAGLEVLSAERLNTNAPEILAASHNYSVFLQKAKDYTRYWRAARERHEKALAALKVPSSVRRKREVEQDG